MKECLFCGTEVVSSGRDYECCPTCNFPWAITTEGLKLTDDSWHQAFRENGLSVMHLRDMLTMRVREVLSDYATGRKDIPHDRLKKLTGLLLDLHCHLEGRVVGLEKRIVNTAPRPIPYPYPRPYPHLPVPRRRLS